MEGAGGGLIGDAEEFLDIAVVLEDEVGVGLGGLDVLLVHAADGDEILVDEGFDGAAAFADVAAGAAEAAQVHGGVDINLEVHQGAGAGIPQGEQTFEENYGSGRNDLHVGSAGVGLEVVDGFLDGFAGQQAMEVHEDQVVLDGGGLVVIESGAFGGG